MKWDSNRFLKIKILRSTCPKWNPKVEGKHCSTYTVCIKKPWGKIKCIIVRLVMHDSKQE
jgi:hypothetical protein